MGYLYATLGGALIGLSASIILLVYGRVAGISGIINVSIQPRAEGKSWRLMFLIGLVLGGFIMLKFIPTSFSQIIETPLHIIGLAGFLVGFGTIMGNGCTSGHGVCGISRLSVRSLLATITFIASGVLTVFVYSKVMGV